MFLSYVYFPTLDTMFTALNCKPSQCSAQNNSAALSSILLQHYISRAHAFSLCHLQYKTVYICIPPAIYNGPLECHIILLQCLLPKTQMPGSQLVVSNTLSKKIKIFTKRSKNMFISNLNCSKCRNTGLVVQANNVAKLTSMWQISNALTGLVTA